MRVPKALGRFGTVIFVKVIRVLAAVFAIWLIYHLVYSLGRRKATGRPGMEDDAGNTRRKFVKSSIVEDGEAGDEEES